MSRELMEPLKGKTLEFTGIVTRYGAGKDTKPTVCIADVSIVDMVVSDHCWIEFQPIMGGLKKGTKVKFVAKITRYKKPSDSIHEPAVVDYRLSKVSDFKEI